ncbi:MAG: DNA repair protein RadA [Clostridia bacterium]|nr:DNA repair protein RadA [Clostridia bacterium]
MAKSTTVFFCNNCGYESAKWVGKCPACNEWNTMVEEKVVVSKGNEKKVASESVKPVLLSDIAIEEGYRFDTGFHEFNHVLGGGLTKGSLTLVGGDPGIGKSTLILQMCDKINIDGKILYVSGEESGSQVKMRAERLKVNSNKILFLGETDMLNIESRIDECAPQLLVIDSIQTMYDPTMESTAGSVGQVRSVTAKFMEIAKKRGITTLIIGHVTKEGAIAGPRVLEHMVDTVLYLEGESSFSYRILRAVKNRFGSTNEIGIFEMQTEGMVEVKDSSELFLSKDKSMPGSVVVCTMEGTRPMLVEIQALSSKTPFGMPRRMSTGVDYNRVTLLTAVLEKKAGFMLYDQDIYLNVAGGVKINEPAVDLGVILAIVSSFKNKPIKPGGVIIGEVGLTGEIRNVNFIEKRIYEAEKTGFKYCVIPKNNLKNIDNNFNIEIIEADNLSDLVKEIIV